MASRLNQLSGIKYTLERKPLFGFGSNAHTRGLVKYEMQPGKWWNIPTFDMGIIAIMCQYGIVGTIGYAALYGSLLFTTIRKKYCKDALMSALLMCLLTFFLCLITIAGIDSVFWIIAGFIVCLANIILRENTPAEA